ncbi:MAG: hypothetical protein N2255_05295 [Kiritimatiellae bacterium]|nr:hypothetical protein [Kiritimatiellia bacterium]
MKISSVLALFIIGTPVALHICHAIDYEKFGPHGEGGQINGQNMTIGEGGAVYELDAFVNISAKDLNGAEYGTSARLSRDSLPPELAFSFTNTLSADRTDLLLRYEFRNDGSNDIFGVRFFALLDAEIDEELNTFFNEYGEVHGVAGLGSGDPWADFWQIDEPGFVGGTLLTRLLDGQLEQRNKVPRNRPNDTALALGFDLGRIRPRGLIAVNILISEDGATTGRLALTHHDLDEKSATVITYSGQADRILRELTNLVVVGAERMKMGTSQTNACEAYFSDRTKEDVTSLAQWDLFGPSPAGTTVMGPVLTAGAVTNPTPVYVRARYGYRDVTLSGTLRVVIEPPQEFKEVTGDVELRFSWRLDYSTGALIGTLRIANRTAQRILANRFHLALHRSSDFFFAKPDGTMPDGDAYVDLTSAVLSALWRAGGDNRLDPGESVEVTGFRVYSRDRRPPPSSLFELWSDVM